MANWYTNSQDRGTVNTEALKKVINTTSAHDKLDTVSKLYLVQNVR